jgi:hypothetical protein
MDIKPTLPKSIPYTSSDLDDFYLDYYKEHFENDEDGIDGVHKAIIFCLQNNIQFPKWLRDHLFQASDEFLRQGATEKLIGKNRITEQQIIKTWRWAALKIELDHRNYDNQETGKEETRAVHSRDTSEQPIKPTDDCASRAIKLLKFLSDAQKETLSPENKELQKEIRESIKGYETFVRELKYIYDPENDDHLGPAIKALNRWSKSQIKPEIRTLIELRITQIRNFLSELGESAVSWNKK